MQKAIMRKGLVVAIIVLFIGIGIQPVIAINLKNSDDSSIKAIDNDNQNNGLFEIPFQIHKSGKIETYKLTITEEQRAEFEFFSDAFKEELEEAETFDETIEIYNNAIVTLDKIGIIPKDTSVEELQQLITGNVQLELFRYLMQIYRYKRNLDTYENFFCLLTGGSSNTVWFYGYSPFWIGSIIYGFEYRTGPEPAQGWIHSQSFFKKFTYVGTFVGKIKKDSFHDPQVLAWTGSKAFRGLYIALFDFYIGRAFRVWITPEVW
jgi:hypothetical protein